MTWRDRNPNRYREIKLANNTGPMVLSKLRPGGNLEERLGTTGVLAAIFSGDVSGEKDKLANTGCHLKRMRCAVSR